MSRMGIGSHVEVVVTRGLLVVQRQVVHNLVTQIGDEYYGERAAGIASPPDQVTGMRLGTGTTDTAKTGVGAAIVTYISGSNQAIEGGYPASSLTDGARRVQWTSIWDAGDATHGAITEAVITNETPLTNVAGTAANTIARIVFAPVAKGVSDTLTINWSHDLLGA